MPVSGLRRRIASIFGRIASILLRGGEMDAAAMACRCALKLDPENLAAHISLSALQHAKGQMEEARKTLETGIRNNPFYVRHCPTEPLAHLLTVRGVQGGHYMIQKRHTEEFKITLRGGNISDRYLIDKEKFTVTNFFIMNGNILSHPDIPGFDLIFNTISDPDLEPEALETLHTFIGKHPEVPVINHPAQVITTTRDNNYRRFKGVAGILFPKTLRIAGERHRYEDVIGAMERNGLSFPVLVREAGMHTGRTLRKFDSLDDLKTGFSYENARDLYVTQYVECLFRERYFRKMRVFFVDGRIFPVVCHVDTEWNVHGDNRTNLMLKNPWMMDEEKAFMSDPQGYLGGVRYELLQGLYTKIDLDFLGVDFTVTDDGNILIFEVNPVMIHKFDHARSFPYLTPYLEDISDAFNDMIIARLDAV